MDKIGYYYQLTLKMFLEQGMSFAPNQIIKYRDQLQFTYTEHYNRVKKLSNALKSLGVRPGEAVGMLDWDTHRYLEAHWAIPLYGSLFHTVNVRMSPEQIKFCINHAEDVVLFVNEEFIPLLESIQDELTTVKTFVLMTDTPGHVPSTTLPNTIEYEQLLSQQSTAYEFPEISEDTRATLCYTSGTTGNPKGVVFTQRDLVMHAISVLISFSCYPQGMNVQANQVYMPLTPMFHVQAWTVPYFAFMLGNKFILPGKYEPSLILKWLSEEKVNHSHCVTTILHMLLFHPDVEKYDLSHWRVDLGGAKLTRQLAERAWELGVFTLSSYGMTETCPAMTICNIKPEHYDLPVEDQIAYRIKSGIPYTWGQIKVVDEDYNEMPKDGKSVGNVIFRSPWCTHEYFHDPEKTKELWRNDWLNTGDVGYMDLEGYLVITDRNKDAIKSGGEWISTLTLEDAISQFPPILECAVIGIPHPRWDERPCVFIALKPGQNASAEDVRNHLLKFADAGKIEKWWIPDLPDGYVFIDAIPHNYIGKIEKVTLRKMYAEGKK
ncbi:MAG: long-chain fatty acid--CoA ligase [Syntrophomonadaceae bacterium]|nr:long-chain fatty acid--CoA ligase [Syntrophomonadaceae bacterium]